MHVWAVQAVQLYPKDHTTIQLQGSVFEGLLCVTITYIAVNLKCLIHFFQVKQLFEATPVISFVCHTSFLLLFFLQASGCTWQGAVFPA